MINQFYIDYIKAIENPDRVGWNGKVWIAPQYKGYDKNQRGYGIDIVKNDSAKRLTQNRPGQWLTEGEADKLMKEHLLYVYGAAQKHIEGFNNLSNKRKAALLGMLYRGDSVNKNKHIIDINEPDDNKFFESISNYYKSKGLNNRAKNSSNFFSQYQTNFLIPMKWELWRPPMKFKNGGQVRKMQTAAGGPLFPWQGLNEEWVNEWKFRTTPASRSRVLSGKGVETDKQYTERRKKETTKRTWRSDAADIAHGVGEGVLALNPYTAIPYFGAKVGQDVLNGNVSWLTALNASVPLFHLAPQAVGLREATNVALEDAANAGSKTARNWRVAREINLATKNKPNLSNRTVSSERSVNGITGVPEVQYTLYNEFGEPIGLTNIGGATLGHINRVSKTSNRMVDGIYSKNKAHKVSEDTYNVAIEDILNNGGVGLESGWSLMSPEKTMATTSKFPYRVIGLEFGNPVRLLTGNTKRAIPQRVLGNHYLEIKPKTEIKFNEVTGEFEEIPIKEFVLEPPTSLKFFERKPSKISEAERVGVPKGERNVKQGYLLKDAIEEANKFAEKWGYDKLSKNATLLDIENLYNQHNTFFRGVTTEQLENTKNRIAKELGINPELLTNDLYLLYVSTHPWPGNDRIWVTPFSHYGKIYGNTDIIGGKGQVSAVMRPWKTTKDIKQWPKLSLWTLGFKEDISNPVITPWVSNAPDAIRSLGAQSELLVKSPLIYRGLGKDFKGTFLLYLKYNDNQGKLGWIESLVGELPLEIIIEKQGGKMNILEFLKNGSGIHIKEKNKGKFTSYCGGKVTDECILKGKNSSNPAIRKRATFAANARKWKHKSGGRIDFLSLGGIAKNIGNIVGNIGAVANSDIGKAGISMATNLFKGVSNAGKITDAAIAALEAIDARKTADRTRSFFEHLGKVKQNDINENPDLYVDGSIIHNLGGVNDENRIYTNAINSFLFDTSKYDLEKQLIMELAQAAQDLNTAQMAGNIFDLIQGLSTSIFGNKNKAATKGTATGSTIGTTGSPDSSKQVITTNSGMSGTVDDWRKAILG